MSESPNPGGSSPANEPVTIQVRSLLVAGRQLSWPLFAQLPEVSPVDYPRKRIPGELLGTVGCPPSPTYPLLGRVCGGRCPFSAHHHVLWLREDDGQLCCWTVTEARLQALAPRARALWWKHGQDLSDLLALSLAQEARHERLSGNRVRMGGHVLGLTPQALLLVRQLDWMRRTHDEDLARLRQQCLATDPGEPGAGGGVGVTSAWRMLASLMAAGVLLDRLALRGITLDHPLCWRGALGGRAWKLMADGGYEAVGIDTGPRREFPSEPGLYLSAPEVDVTEICQQVAAHFPALRVLLAKGAVSHQMAQIAMAAREKAALLARGGVIGAALLAHYCEPVAEAELPPAEALHACYQSERAQQMAWVGRLESLAVGVHALPRFTVQPPAGGGGAPPPPPSPLSQTGGEQPPEQSLPPGATLTREREGEWFEVGGRRMRYFAATPGRHAPWNGGVPDLAGQFAWQREVGQGVPTWPPDIPDAREVAGMVHVPPRRWCSHSHHAPR